MGCWDNSGYRGGPGSMVTDSGLVMRLGPSPTPPPAFPPPCGVGCGQLPEVLLANHFLSSVQPLPLLLILIRFGIQDKPEAQSLTQENRRGTPAWKYF